jgi:hypothetical protein
VCHREPSDEPAATVNAEVVLAAEHRNRDLAHGLSLSTFGRWRRLAAALVAQRTLRSIRRVRAFDQPPAADQLAW